MTAPKLLVCFILSFAFLIGCASTPDEAPAAKVDGDISMPPRKVAPLPQPPEREEILVDYLGLQRSLGLDREKDELGYIEKSFDTCSAGFGYSASRDCRRNTFVLIHFQILCRDSEGTISNAVGREDMKPLSGRILNWTVKGSKGGMRLDGEGFGQIRMIFPSSQRLERLKLAVDNDFVYVRAGEVKRLVTPRNWCN